MTSEGGGHSLERPSPEAVRPRLRHLPSFSPVRPYQHTALLFPHHFLFTSVTFITPHVRRVTTMPLQFAVCRCLLPLSDRVKSYRAAPGSRSGPRTYIVISGQRGYEPLARGGGGGVSRAKSGLLRTESIAELSRAKLLAENEDWLPWKPTSISARVAAARNGSVAQESQAR